MPSGAGLAVVEDACQAHGARHRGKRVGGFGLAAAFSFYPAKNLGAYGEGGALTTDDAAVAETARALRDHGQADRYRSEAVGFNYRMDGLQAAVLRIKLKRLDEWTARRRELAALYRELLAEAGVDLQADDPADECVYHLFAVGVEDRDAVREELAAEGVETGIHYPIPIHLQAAYASLGHRQGDFPAAERACERTLSLPIFPELTADQVERVASRLREATGRQR